MTRTAAAESGSRSVRIGGGSGFWGDSSEGFVQMVEKGEVQYLILDYLAEITMSILARMRQKNEAMGYVLEFVTLVGEHAAKLADRKIKVIANAGGINPAACASALRALLREKGIDLKVAAVVGDDVSPLLDDLRREKTTEMSGTEELPGQILSANAYTGAFPIAAALAENADIVVVGRCADSALALGPLIHEFGWQPHDFDLLAAGSLAGHVIECGPQATGGIFTDWELVADGWADIGYPIAICYPDGTFDVTKPGQTGGLVSWATVAEQITYETGDPRSYILPDVICDLSQVKVEETGKDRVRVSGVRGTGAPAAYKVSATYQDGYRCIATLLLRGGNAVPKAQAVANAVLGRCRSIFLRRNLGDFTETSVEILGAEDGFGANAATGAAREVVIKIAVRHPDREGAEVFSREIAPATVGMAQGLAGIMGGRPKVQPVVRLFSFLVDKARVPLSVAFPDRTVDVPVAGGAQADAGRISGGDAAALGRPAVPAARQTVTVPLRAIAYGRSGDKGNVSNVAVLARREEFLPIIAEQVTDKAVADHMAHLVEGSVTRFDWPGLRGFNFLMEKALGGGGIASLRYDPQGKAHGQILLEMPVEVPAELLERHGANQRTGG